MGIRNEEDKVHSAFEQSYLSPGFCAFCKIDDLQWWILSGGKGTPRCRCPEKNDSGEAAKSRIGYPFPIYAGPTDQERLYHYVWRLGYKAQLPVGSEGDTPRMASVDREKYLYRRYPLSGGEKIWYQTESPLKPFGIWTQVSDEASKELEKEEKRYPFEVANREGIKHDGGKLRYDLISPVSLEGLVQVLTFGATKYGDRNWEKGMSWGRVFGAAMRHLWKWWLRRGIDNETGLSHLAHAAACIHFLQHYEALKVGKDSRP